MESYVEETDISKGKFNNVSVSNIRLMVLIVKADNGIVKKVIATTLHEHAE